MSFKEHIKTRLANALGMQVTAQPSAGIRVLTSRPPNLFVTEEYDHQGGRILRVAHAGGQGALALDLNGQQSQVTYFERGGGELPNRADPTGLGSRPRRDQLVYQPGSETLATHLYEQLKQSIVGDAVSPSPWLRRAGAMALFLFLAGFALMLMGVGNTPAPKPVGAAQSGVSMAAMAAPAPAPAPAPQAGAERVPAEARASEQERAAVAALKGVIKIGAAGKPIYVFTDPNCPYCREFERTLENVPVGFQPVIIPLGYKPGSLAAASAVLCAPNPASAWRQTMLGGSPPLPKACDNGERLVRQNMELFESMRLNRTPTTLTPDGFLVSGAASAQELALILGGGN
ncbi:MAG TPA: DsbC family protein [Xanthomonadales bacterium]|nr:DsbC family protein [Xanthomonadales bacterium]